MGKASELESEEFAGPRCIELPVRMLRLDGDTQSRTRLNPNVIQEYVELIREGIELPPVRAGFDGETYWLTDGFHRVAAVELLGHKTTRTEVFHGTLSDAKWDSYRANAVHGLRRTPADLRLVIARVLRHEKSANLSNCELARHLHVSEKTIRRFRSQLCSAHSEDERVAIRNGRQYRIRTANIGKGKPISRQRAEGQVAATLERRLNADLLIMDREASPDVRRILNVFGNWIQRCPNPSNVLQALTAIVAELKAKPSVMRPSRT